MDILVLIGPPNSGKEEVLNIVNDLLVEDKRGESKPNNVLGTKKYKGKVISFFTNGNNSSSIDSAVKEFKRQGVEILICICDKDILDSVIEFKKEAYRVIIFNNEELIDCTNLEVANTIIATVKNSDVDFAIHEFMKRIKVGVEETPLTNHEGMEFTAFLKLSLDNYNKFFKEKMKDYINQYFP